MLSVLQRLRPVRDRVSSLVTPDTIRRWHRDLVRAKWRYCHRVVFARGGSPTTCGFSSGVWPARNPTWGYCRLRGELKKLGAEISTTSIRRIVAEKRRPPPRRETWRQFMRSQASSIIACDLFTVESVRLKTLHVLFFIDLHTTEGPHRWGDRRRRQCRLVRPNRPEPDRGTRGRDEPIRYLVHDRDKRFCPVFDEVFRAEGIEILRTPWRAPKANAYAERFIRTVRTECLDRVLLLGERHLRSVLETYVEHYNRKQPHRGPTLLPRRGPEDVSPLTIDDSVRRRDLVGWLDS